MKDKIVLRLNPFLAFLAVCAIATEMARAQQDPQYTQYMFNTMVINPAFAGSRGVSSVGLLHRSQWLGLDGAPTTQTFNFSSPLSNRVGLGFAIVNDEIGNGTSKETSFDASFSYTIPVSEIGNLAFGIKAGGHLLSLDFTKLVNYGAETNLPNIDNKFSPNFGVGAYYFSERFFTGLSIPNLLQTEHFDNASQSSSYLAAERMNIYLISGYVFELNRNMKFRPATLIKMVGGAPVQIDLSANMLFNDKFSLGAAYRLGAAVSALFGFQVTDKFLMGLAYDVETTALGNTQFNDGSFEVFLRYDFINRINRRAVNNRFF